MHPILFSLGPLNIYSYGAFIALGFLTAIFLIEKEAKVKGIPVDKISNLCVAAFISSLLGARIMYVVINFSFYRENPIEIFMLHRGGLMFHGGFIAGIVVTLFYLKKSKIEKLLVLDIVALYLPIGQAIGRIGCLLNGCCFGKECNLPWAIKLASETITRHPTQIYEAIGSLITFMILRLIDQRYTRTAHLLPKGIIFSLYLILYPINRIIVEGFRADLPPMWMGLSLTQWMSAGIFIVGIVIWWRQSLFRS